MLAIDGLKKCSNSKCGVKPVTDFQRNKAMTDGLNNVCRQCDSEFGKSYHARNKTRRNAARRDNYAKKGLVAAANDRKRRSRYGVTNEDYERMLAAQDGKCAVCKLPPRGNRRVLCVDHNHVTGEVRLLLCHSCNAALGLLSEDADRCYRMAAYSATYAPKLALEVR